MSLRGTRGVGGRMAQVALAVPVALVLGAVPAVGLSAPAQVVPSGPRPEAPPSSNTPQPPPPPSPAQQAAPNYEWNYGADGGGGGG